MESLVAVVGVILILPILGYLAAEESYKLKIASVIFLVVLLLSSSTLTTEWGRMTSELVDNDEDPHYGLPDIWNGKQVVCFHFPEDAVPSEFIDGRHHIDIDGTDFKTDKNWNSTGACVGGFEGYEIGIDLLYAAIELRPVLFELNATDYGELGLFINSIGGFDPCDHGPCSMSDNIWTSWQILHNGGVSFTGISSLGLNEDSVLTFELTTSTW
tara:strand:- start:2551 stop:3192 length:642 start_codon:yes stop_codon:yes gene_type:complete